ncbi:hypothetical protein XENTR_v10007273 [Xenopus tropicalis]|nr:hypothetical protein XENTR_v10007273 [Xenopus tropicalis]
MSSRICSGGHAWRGCVGSKRPEYITLSVSMGPQEGNILFRKALKLESYSLRKPGFVCFWPAQRMLGVPPSLVMGTMSGWPPE